MPSPAGAIKVTMLIAHGSGIYAYYLQYAGK